MAIDTTLDQVEALYIGYFGRAGEPNGVNYWVGQLNNGYSVADMAASFSVQDEAKAEYPFLANPNVVTDPVGFITAIYQNLFERAPDADGLNYWTQQLLGRGGDAQAIGQFIQDVISGAQADDITTLDNKIDAASYFTQELAQAGIGGTHDGALDTNLQVPAHDAVGSVSSDPATVDASKAATDTFVDGNANPGVDLSLTTAIDNLHGTSGNDTFTGVTNGAQSTLQSGDAIDGGAGNDTLHIVASQNATNLLPTLTSVENILVNNLTVNLDVNLANSTGVKAVEVANSPTGGTTTFSSVSNLVDASVVNSAMQNLVISYSASAVAGTSDVQNVTLNNAGTVGAGVGVTAQGIESFVLHVEGVNYANVISGQQSAVTVDGGGSLYSTIGGTVKTFDASANTGGVHVDVSGTGDITATGGSGDDGFRFDGSFTKTDHVDGGAGYDTVLISGGDYSTAANAAGINGLTSIEHLVFNSSAATTINLNTLTNAAITNFQFDTSAANDIINNADAAHTFEFGTANGGTATFNMAVGQSELNIDMMGSAGGPAVGDGTDANVGAVTVALAPGATTSTVNIASHGDLGAAVYNDIGAVTAAAGSTFTLTGEGNLAIASFTNSATIDASGLTGSLHIEGSQATLVTVVDAKLSGADTITLGAGHDTVFFNSGLDSGAINGTTGAPAGSLFVDTINSFQAGAGGDVLDATIGGTTSTYAAVSAAAQASINALSGVGATMQAAADYAAGSAANDGWTAFDFGGSTYALYSGDGNTTYNAGTDMLVHLAGIHAADLTAANFA